MTPGPNRKWTACGHLVWNALRGLQNCRSSKAIYFLLPFALLNGLMLLVFVNRHSDEQIRVSADSRQYHFVAANLLAGRGYFDLPVSAAREYDSWTRETFADRFKNQLNDGAKPPQIAEITPGYPLFLAGIYRLHGVSPDMVVSYQRGLVVAVGLLMIVVGWQLLATLGAVTASLAVVLLGMNPEFAYPVNALLTEMLAASLLLGAFSGALWAKRTHWSAEALVGVLLSLAVLTRPALVFAALLYGLCLLIGRSGERVGRASAYAAPCVLLLGFWIGFASIHAGTFVPLASYGVDTVKMGLRAETGAKLTKSGISGSDIRDRDLRVELSRAIASPSSALSVMGVKLKESIDHVPRFLWNAIALGFALLSAMSVCSVQGQGTGGRSTVVEVRPTGARALARRSTLLVVLGISVLLLYSVGAGWSATWMQAWFMVLPVAFLFVRIDVTVHGSAPLPFYRDDYRGILAWIFGFLMIVVLTIGLRRYMRPFLPEFYLMAVFSMPLALFWFAALLQVRIGDHGPRFQWLSPNIREPFA